MKEKMFKVELFYEVNQKGKKKKKRKEMHDKKTYGKKKGQWSFNLASILILKMLSAVYSQKKKKKKKRTKIDKNIYIYIYILKMLKVIHICEPRTYLITTQLISLCTQSITHLFKISQLSIINIILNRCNWKCDLLY